MAPILKVKNKHLASQWSELFQSLININSADLEQITLTDSDVDHYGGPTIFVGANPPKRSGDRSIWIPRLLEISELEIVLADLLGESSSHPILSKELDSKNKQLEQMNDQMEAQVAQRTASIVQAKRDAELKQKRTRGLVDFIQALSEVDTIGDFLERSRSHFKDSFLINDIHIKDQEMPELEMRRKIANQLGRPVGRLLNVRLHTRMNPSPILYIEHSLADAELNQFLDFITARLQALSLAAERILLFDQLTKSSIEWEETFDTLSDPVGIIDTDYKLLRSNLSFGNSYYRSKCHKIFSGSDRPCEGCPINDAVKLGSPNSGEIRVKGRIYRVHAYPIRISPSETVTTIVNHYVDVTEDKVFYSKVIQHEKMTALGIMAGHIAHELNNPLTGIRSLAQILASDSSVPEKIRKDLFEIESASDRCQTIIKNLLEFTFPSEENEPSSISLNEVIKKTLPLLKTALRNHSSHIELCLDEVPVVANFNLLQQVVFNLVNNACQAMLNPGHVYIQTERVVGGMVLSIRDSGPGIPVEFQKRIFEPFFTTKPEGEGTGLGLNMSRAIIEKFSGKIELVSSSSEGTHFKIFLRDKK